MSCREVGETDDVQEFTATGSPGEEKAEKRRKERLREKKQLKQSLTNRLEVRLGKQTPEAWTGELPQDVALFDESRLVQLSAEEAAEARGCEKCSREVWERRLHDNVESLSSIPRRSPYSEWRMFVRGLVAWQAGSLEEAKDVWARLDKCRDRGGWLCRWFWLTDLI